MEAPLGCGCRWAPVASHHKKYVESSFYIDSRACVPVENYVSGLALLSANGFRFEINQLLLAYDTALVADLEKLCRLVNEFGRVCERKFRVNVGKTKVITCSRNVNGVPMHVILNSELVEEVDCFKYLWSQVAADGGCERDMVHRMNEGYRAYVGSAEKCAEQ